MLKSLAIRNIVLIEKLDIDFTQGLTVLTGETGAGKSIIIDSISLVIGVRAERRLIRSGAEKASVTAIFSSSNAIEEKLSELEIEKSDELIIRRVIYADGKSKAYINDQQVTQKALAFIGEDLVEIQGQNDRYGLLDSKNHRALLDRYAGIDTSEIEKKYRLLADTRKQHQLLKEQVEKIAGEQDYLSYVVEELKNANPQENEEDGLVEKRAVLKNSDNILKSIAKASQLLGDGENIVEAGQALRRIDSSAAEMAQNASDAIDRASSELQEAIELLADLFQQFNKGNDNSLEELEDRLHLLRELARKYRITPNELPQYYDSIRKKLSLITDSDNQLAELAQKIKSLREDYLKEANKISDIRKKAGLALAELVSAELDGLKMASCELQISQQILDNETSYGIDDISFVVRTNIGSDFGELGKTASGGELSRILLAIKVILSAGQNMLLIFDEIDTGVSGKVASAIGSRLKMLSQTGQLFSITHQAQVAGYGDSHILISKNVEGDNTLTNIKILNQQQRIKEMARMVSGEDITPEAIAAAQKLMR